jgi:hypothetical protein
LDHLPALIYLMISRWHQDLYSMNENFKTDKIKVRACKVQLCKFKDRNSDLTSPMFHSANQAKSLSQPSVQVHSSYKAFSKNNQTNTKRFAQWLPLNTHRPHTQT